MFLGVHICRKNTISIYQSKTRLSYVKNAFESITRKTFTGKRGDKKVTNLFTMLLQKFRRLY